MDIHITLTTAEITACFPAFHELRPHLSQQNFIAQVQRQTREYGYVVVCITTQDDVFTTKPNNGLCNQIHAWAASVTVEFSMMALTCSL